MEDYLQLENVSSDTEQTSIETAPNLNGDPIGVYDAETHSMVFQLCDWQYSIQVS